MKKILLIVVFILAFSPIVFCDKSEKDWTAQQTANFIIKTQKNSSTISTPNLSMKLEQIYATLRLNIGWMMPNDKITVRIYNSQENYLKGEGEYAKGSRALAYPLENTIAFYDNKENFENTKQDMAHEIVHMFTSGYFNPEQDAKLDMPPRWLDEGMATLLEDSVADEQEDKVWAKLLFEDKNFAKFKDFFNEKENYSLDWYVQSYAIVRFLFNPYDSKIAKRKVQFKKFCELLKQGKDLDYALRKVYHYKNMDQLEKKFYKWYKKVEKRKNREKKDYDFFLNI